MLGIVREASLDQDDFAVSGHGVERVPGIPELWAASTGHEAVCIAVLDGPVDLGHPHFAGAKLSVEDPLGIVAGTQLEQFSPSSALAHGTMVAGIICAQHASGLFGIAPQCTILAVPIHRPSADGGTEETSQDDLATGLVAALDFAERNRLALVINVSAGQLLPPYCATASSAPCAPSNRLAEALAKCAARQVLVFAATGNDGCDCIHVPAADPAVVAIGAATLSGSPLTSSNYGGAYQSNGLLAPGQSIISSALGGGVATYTGTSVATAVASAIAALLLSVQYATNGSISGKHVREALFRTATSRTAAPSDEMARRLLNGVISPAEALTFLKEVIEMSENTESKGTTAQVCQECGASDSDMERKVASGQSTVQGSPGAPVTTSSISSRIGLSASSSEPGNVGSFVYLVSNHLSVDIPLPARQDSINSRIGLGSGRVGIEDPLILIRYLLGGYWDNFVGGGRRLNGAIHDTKNLNWVLEQDGAPMYVVSPTGPFAEAANIELVLFLIEQEIGSWPECRPWLEYCKIDVSLLDYFSRTYQGQSQSEPVKAKLGTDQERQAFVSSLRRVEFLSVPGTITGTTVLRSGQRVETINPTMRGTASWDTVGLVDVFAARISGSGTKAQSQIARPGSPSLLLNSLYQEVRNTGKTPEERAKNFAVTEVLNDFSALLSTPDSDFSRFFGAGSFIGVDSVRAFKNARSRVLSEYYDVEISFFDAIDKDRGFYVLAYTYDVADVVPAFIGSSRQYVRKS